MNRDQPPDVEELGAKGKSPRRDRRPSTAGISWSAWVPATELALTLLALMGLSACGPSPTVDAPELKTSSVTASTDTPNVILIVADAMRADRLSAYGHGRPTSPNIEALARDGVLFERAFSQAPWTPPSMASLMTGFYQSSHRVIQSPRKDGKHSKLSERFETMAELFRSVGYRTAAVTAQPWVSESTGFAQGFEEFKLLSSLDDPHNTDKVILGGIDWIAQHKEERFFLYLHMMDPHFPYEVPEPFIFNSEVPEIFADGIGLDQLGDWNDPSASPTDEQLAYVLDTYDAEIRYVDWWIGVLDRHLQELDLRDETLIVFTSDHGEAFYEHGEYGHITTIYNEMLHIPLIFSQPGWLDGPRRESLPVESVDILPTLAQIIGFEVAKELPGDSLLSGEGLGLAFTEGAGLDSFKLQSDAFSVIFDRRSGTWEAYDLATDPGEQVDVSVEREDDSVDFMRQMRDIQRRAAELALAVEDSDVVLDEQTVRELEALGYTP